jgi:hypothetical protein
VADALDYVGVLTLEFFATADGPVFNEMAPRVHNSGHWTIEGALVSQFENHIRAIRLPLGSTALAAKGAVMDNLIGDAARLGADPVRSRQPPAPLWQGGGRPGQDGPRHPADPVMAQALVLIYARAANGTIGGTTRCLAPSGGPAAVQGADHGQADDHGPQDVRELSRAAARPPPYRADARCRLAAEGAEVVHDVRPRWRWPAMARWP